MTSSTVPSRRFPSVGWAWPSADLDNLLYAAMGPNRTVALARVEEWLKRNDIDVVSFAEHRLLAAIAERFGKELQRFAEYPRLLGVQRLLWTKSRMSARQATPVIRAMVDAGLEVMLIKGASRIAIDPAAQKSRASYDIDILLQSRDFGPALDILWDQGWQSASGESRLCLQSRVDSIRAMNFFKGRFGDVDAHQQAYHLVNSHEQADRDIWVTKSAADYFDLPVFVPSTEERISMAIAHGGLDAHKHSDWLVDCGAAITCETVDWDRVMSLLRIRSISVQALVALSYLHYKLGINVPRDVLESLSRSSKWYSPGRYSSLLQAKPRQDWGLASGSARVIAKQIRLRSTGQNNIEGYRRPIWKGEVKRLQDPEVGEISAIRHQLDALEPIQSASFSYTLEALVPLPVARRRLEFEINSQNRHIARLRARTYLKQAGIGRLRFSGKLDLEPGDRELWLEARPGRQLRGDEPAELKKRYDPVPFRVTKFSLSFDKP